MLTSILRLQQTSIVCSLDVYKGKEATKMSSSIKIEHSSTQQKSWMKRLKILTEKISTHSSEGGALNITVIPVRSGFGDRSNLRRGCLHLISQKCLLEKDEVMWSTLAIGKWLVRLDSLALVRQSVYRNES